MGTSCTFCSDVCTCQISIWTFRVFPLRVWEYGDDAMAVDPTFSYDSSPSFERDIWGGWSCWPTFVANVLSCGPMDKAFDCNSLKLAGFMVLNQCIKIVLLTLCLVTCCYKVSVWPLRRCCRNKSLDSSGLPRDKCSISRFDFDMLFLTPPPSPPSILGQQSEKNPFFLH